MEGGLETQDISCKENTVCAVNIEAGIQNNWGKVPVPVFCFFEE